MFKQTIGGVGTFPVTVTPHRGRPPPSTATTTTEGVPVEACTPAPVTCDVVDNPATLPGDYTVAETLPVTTGAGSWAVTAFDGNGVAGPVSTTQTVPVMLALESLACTFTNTFTPTGSITITKTTVGGTGITEFAVVPDPPTGEGDTTDPVYSATTTTPGVPSTATQVSGDYTLDALDLGQFSIVESGPDDTVAGSWAPQGMTCNGTYTAPTASDVLVTLTTVDPHVTCVFTNAFTTAPPATTTTTTTTAVPVMMTTTVPSGAAAADTGAGGSGQALAMTGEDVRIPLGIAVGSGPQFGASLLLVDRARRRRHLPLVVERRRDQPLNSRTARARLVCPGRHPAP